MKALPLLLLIAPTFLFIGQASKAEDAGHAGRVFGCAARIRGS